MLLNFQLSLPATQAILNALSRQQEEGDALLRNLRDQATAQLKPPAEAPAEPPAKVDEPAVV